VVVVVLEFVVVVVVLVVVVVVVVVAKRICTFIHSCSHEDVTIIHVRPVVLL
jgi:hypothetical protein